MTPRPTNTAAAPRNSSTKSVSAGEPKGASIWTATRVVALVFAVLEVLLLIRFTLRLFGANSEQPLVSAIYRFTEPLVAPFRGIFGQPADTQGVEVAALLSIVFFVLVGALIIALVRAFTGKRGELDPRPEADRTE